jgi:hypothetical protein
MDIAAIVAVIALGVGPLLIYRHFRRLGQCLTRSGLIWPAQSRGVG